MLNKIVRLFVTFLLCFATLQGCASTRVAQQSHIEQLDFEIYSLTSRLDRLESKIDLLNWSVSPPPGLSKSAWEDGRKEQLEKLVVELKAQISSLSQQLSTSEVYSRAGDRAAN